jgi:hypothetical protein
MLAIQSHLKDICKVLAAKVLTASCNHSAEPKSDDESSDCCSTQVHLHAIVTCLRRCLVHPLWERTHRTYMLSASYAMPVGPQIAGTTAPVTCNYKRNTKCKYKPVAAKRVYNMSLQAGSQKIGQAPEKQTGYIAEVH